MSRVFRLLRGKSGWLAFYAAAFALINLAGLRNSITDEQWFAAAFHAAAIAASLAVAVTEALDWRHYGRLARKADALPGVPAPIDREESSSG